MAKPKKYDPGKVNKHVVRVAVKGTTKFGASHNWEPHEYPLEVLSKKPDEIVALRNIHVNVNDWAGMQDMMLKYGGVKKVHELPIRSDRIFDKTGKGHLTKASRIISKNIEKGKRTVVTCNYGYRRTAAALYLVHRRMGASHEEALTHIRLPNVKEAFTDVEKEHLDELFSERKNYGG